MKAAETLKEFESLGNERNRKIYPRHGVRGPMFGVSYADLGKVEVDHGETGCKTPGVIAYLAKVDAFRSKKSKAAR